MSGTIRINKSLIKHKKKFYIAGSRYILKKFKYGLFILQIYMVKKWKSSVADPPDPQVFGHGSADSQRHGSADPDPHQNVMDPQHWKKDMQKLCMPRCSLVHWGRELELLCEDRFRELRWGTWQKSENNFDHPKSRHFPDRLRLLSRSNADLFCNSVLLINGKYAKSSSYRWGHAKFRLFSVRYGEFWHFKQVLSTYGN